MGAIKTLWIAIKTLLIQFHCIEKALQTLWFDLKTVLIDLETLSFDSKMVLIGLETVWIGFLPFPALLSWRLGGLAALLASGASATRPLGS